MDSPSPDKYNIPSAFDVITTKKSGIKFSMSSRRINDVNHRNQSPGPGSYVIPSSVANIPYYEKKR